jgi:hypothetical protein
MSRFSGIPLALKSIMTNSFSFGYERMQPTTTFHGNRAESSLLHPEKKNRLFLKESQKSVRKQKRFLAENFFREC